MSSHAGTTQQSKSYKAYNITRLLVSLWRHARATEKRRRELFLSMRALILSGKQAFDNGLGVSFEVFFFFFFAVGVSATKPPLQSWLDPKKLSKSMSLAICIGGNNMAKYLVDPGLKLQLLNSKSCFGSKPAAVGWTNDSYNLG